MESKTVLQELCYKEHGIIWTFLSFIYDVIKV